MDSGTEVTVDRPLATLGDHTWVHMPPRRQIHAASRPRPPERPHVDLRVSGVVEGGSAAAGFCDESRFAVRGAGSHQIRRYGGAVADADCVLPGASPWMTQTGVLPQQPGKPVGAHPIGPPGTAGRSPSRRRGRGAGTPWGAGRSPLWTWRAARPGRAATPPGSSWTALSATKSLATGKQARLILFGGRVSVGGTISTPWECACLLTRCWRICGLRVLSWIGLLVGWLLTSGLGVRRLTDGRSRIRLRIWRGRMRRRGWRWRSRRGLRSC